VQIPFTEGDGEKYLHPNDPLKKSYIYSMSRNPERNENGTGIVHQNVVMTAMYRSHDFSTELPSDVNQDDFR